MIVNIQKLTKVFFANYFDVPKGTGKVALLVFIESFAISISFFVSIYLSKSLGFNQVQIGNLISIMLAGTCAGSFLSGYLVSFIKPSIVASVGFVLFALGFLLLAVISSFELLLPVMFLCGVGGVFMMIANLTALIRLAKDDAMKDRLIVLQSVIFNLTVSVAAFLLSYLTHTQLSKMFLLLAFSLVIAAVIALRLDLTSRKVIIKRKDEKQPIINRPLLLTLIPMIACYGIVFSIVKTYFAIDTVERFDNHLLAWIVMSANPMLVIFIQPGLVRSLRNKGNTQLLLLGGSLLCGGYLLFGLSKMIIPSLIFIAIASIGEMIFSPISKKMAACSLGYGNEGMGLAVWKITYYLSGVFGASFSGYLGHSFNHQYAWMICLPLLMCIILCATLYIKLQNSYLVST